MKINKFFMMLYAILNTTDALSIASLVIDPEHKHQLLIQLIDGEKYEIRIRGTDVLI